MNTQVVSTAVSAANTLNPAVGSLQLAVPAVGGVVSHLVLHVLSEAELGRVNTDPVHEHGDPGDEVTKGLVVDKLGVDSLADGDVGRC